MAVAHDGMTKLQKCIPSLVSPMLEMTWQLANGFLLCARWPCIRATHDLIHP